MRRKNGTMKSRLDAFEKRQIRHNEILSGLNKRVGTMITKMDRDFYKFPTGALFKIAGLARSSAIHWAILFVILGLLAWSQYGK